MMHITTSKILKQLSF